MDEKNITLKKTLETGQLDQFIKQEETRLKKQEGYPAPFKVFGNALSKILKQPQSTNQT